MIKEAIQKVVNRKDLTRKETEEAFGEIMNGVCSDAQISAFITGLRMKTETVDEITAAASVMRQKAVGICKDMEVIDTCGTGGSGKNIFNISTTSAFILAGCGLKVAKHGNRGVSSICGSADLMGALGVKYDLEPQKVEKCINEIGIGFLFAPKFHIAMKYAIKPRQEIAIRTIFNILGPLSNPASAYAQIMGVYDHNLTAKLAKVLANLGVKKAAVVSGLDGLDEISPAVKTKISQLKDKKIKTYLVTSSDFGIKKFSLAKIKGGSPQENAKITLSVLNGEKSFYRDASVMNAAMMLFVTGLAGNFKKGVLIAENSIDSGRALEKLERLKESSNNDK